MRRTTLAVAAAVALIVAGCVGDPSPEPPVTDPTTQPATDPIESIADETRTGIPSGPDFWDAALDESGVSTDGWIVEPVVGWLAQNQTFAVVTWGSSSCPFIATAMGATGVDALSIEFTLAAAEACTDDLAPLTHVFSLPASVTELPITVTITGEDLSDWMTSGLPDLSLSLDLPDSVAESSASGVPEGFAVPDDTDGWDGAPIAGWLEEGQRFAVVLFGSSSCPPIPVSNEARGDGAVEVTFEPGRYEECTSDLSPRTFEFALPEGVTARPVDLTVVRPGAEVYGTISERFELD